MIYTHPVLPLFWNPLLDNDSFCVGQSNVHAFEWIQKEKWPCQHVNIYGPKDSGKTHLGMLWAKKHNAVWLPCAHASFVNTKGKYVLDISSCSFNEQDILGFLEEIRESGSSCLWLSALPLHLYCSYPALRSRVIAFLCIQIQEPDDVLLLKVLKKAFYDVGFIVYPQILDFLVKRMDRSFSSIRTIVEKVHEYTLKHHANLSISVVKAALNWKNDCGM
ncbi:hypothetical protein P618_200853 [Holospora obtusa F1]|uniref:DnaA regulatory inactivator Hda n=1 Tax=Holospora obtusa F1 TaxID=1399147 RepID=W6TGG6_HOLOB|nr:hypothetical protein [Holospora obtusa]ETZ06955.1 hypothetical protein P618_200853 [Holospora obtusa F1]